VACSAGEGFPRRRRTRSKEIVTRHLFHRGRSSKLFAPLALQFRCDEMEEHATIDDAAAAGFRDDRAEGGIVDLLPIVDGEFTSDDDVGFYEKFINGGQFV